MVTPRRRRIGRRVHSSRTVSPVCSMSEEAERSASSTPESQSCSNSCDAVPTCEDKPRSLTDPATKNHRQQAYECVAPYWGKAKHFLVKRFAVNRKASYQLDDSTSENEQNRRRRLSTVLPGADEHPAVPEGGLPYSYRATDSV